MGWRIVKQPNGLLARFSDIVDHFTHYDMTEEEALDVCLGGAMGVGREEARAKVDRGLRDEPIPPFIEDSGRGDGLDRFRDAIDTVRAIHGDGEADKTEAELSRPSPDAGRGEGEGGGA
jgi:hypothetical protein